ncbi:MAG: bifunctional DNA primase/polymerase [Acidimicrobiales bacterium]
MPRARQSGWRVLPIRGHGKIPPINDWPDAASGDWEQIEEWLTRWPDSNIGLVTGEYFDVIDIDGTAGLKSMRNLLSPADRRLSVSGHICRTSRPGPGTATSRASSATPMRPGPPVSGQEGSWSGRSGVAHREEPAGQQPGAVRCSILVPAGTRGRGGSR